MIVYIIAGGSGTRLWPLSTHSKPKHLLSLVNKKSLLLNTLHRVNKLANKENIFIISEQSHVDQVYEQIGDELDKDHVFAEPGRRGTASCVAMALADSKKRGHDEDEPILFLWADHAIRDAEGFALTAMQAGEVARSERKVVFMGAEPTYPATKFGYIQKGPYYDGWKNIFELECFVEKPNGKTAQEYFQAGNYLWNMGYLVATRTTFESAMNSYSPDMGKRYDILCKTSDLEKDYLEFDNVAIDYVFSEKIKGALVIQGGFDWADVGSFEDLHDMSAQDEEGNHIKGDRVAAENTTNSFVLNEVDTPIAVIGLDNVVVVNSPNGLLVINKNYAQKVGDVAKKLQS